MITDRSFQVASDKSSLFMLVLFYVKFLEYIFFVNPRYLVSRTYLQVQVGGRGRQARAKKKRTLTTKTCQDSFLNNLEEPTEHGYLRADKAPYVVSCSSQALHNTTSMYVYLDRWRERVGNKVETSHIKRGMHYVSRILSGAFSFLLYSAAHNKGTGHRAQII